MAAFFAWRPLAQRQYSLAQYRAVSATVSRSSIVMSSRSVLLRIAVVLFVLILGACSRSAPPPAAEAPASAAPAGAAALKVEAAWVRATPPDADSAAAYATLRNDGDKPLRVTQAQTAAAEEAMLHSMSMDNGVMQMRMLDALEVPAHGTATLSPGGTHLMLMGLKQPLVAGGEIDIQLTLDDGQRLGAKFPVREDAP